MPGDAYGSLPSHYLLACCAARSTTARAPARLVRLGCCSTKYFAAPTSSRRRIQHRRPGRQLMGAELRPDSPQAGPSADVTGPPPLHRRAEDGTGEVRVRIHPARPSKAADHPRRSWCAPANDGQAMYYSLRGRAPRGRCCSRSTWPAVTSAVDAQRGGLRGCARHVTRLPKNGGRGRRGRLPPLQPGQCSPRSLEKPGANLFRSGEYSIAPHFSRCAACVAPSTQIRQPERNFASGTA